MGIGFGLSEELKFDEKTGKPLNNNLLDYKMATFEDHPICTGSLWKIMSPPVLTERKLSENRRYVRLRRQSAMRF